MVLYILVVLPMNKIIKFIIILHGIIVFLNALGSIFVYFFGCPISRACENECSTLGYLVRVPESFHHQSREETHQLIDHFPKFSHRKRRVWTSCAPYYLRTNPYAPASGSKSVVSRIPDLRRHHHRRRHLVRLHTIVYPLVSSPCSN